MILRYLGVLCLLHQVLAFKQPNIVLMMADDLGWGDVPWHEPLAQAPTLMELATTGIILDR